LNAAPYKDLGNTNGYSSSAVWGACGSYLETLQIHINSTRASNLVQPFLVESQWCPMKEKEYRDMTQMDCTPFDEKSCGDYPSCTFCKAARRGLPVGSCYNKAEAAVLTHIVSVEDGAGKFVCAGGTEFLKKAM